MRKNNLTAAILIGVFGVGSLASAQDNSGFNGLPTVTVLGNAGDSITNAFIIDENDIDNSLASNPRDLLKSTPGVVLRKGPGSTFDNVRVRGMGTTEGGADRVAVNIDGVPVADSFTLGHATNNGQSYFDIADLKTVDIKKGAAMVDGERSGIAGTVSFVTKDPKDYIQEGKRFGGNVRVGYSGEDQSASGGFSVAGQFSNEFSGMLSYTYRNFHEIKNFDGKDVVGPDRTAKNPTDANSNNLLAKMVFAPNNENQFKLKLGSYKLDSSTKILNKAQSSLADRFDKIETDRQTIAFTHDFDIGTSLFDKGQWEVYYQNSKTDRNNGFQRYSRGGRSGVGYVTSATKYKFKDIGASAKFSRKVDNHAIGYGFRFRQTDVKTRLKYSYPNGSKLVFQTQPDTVTKEYSLFVNDDISLSNGRLHILPSAEVTHYRVSPKKTKGFMSKYENTSQTAFSWGLGATYDITENHQVFGSYRQGIKVPSLHEQNPGGAFHGTVYVPNPNLKPEKSKTFELGLRSSGDLGSQTVSLFHDGYSNFIHAVKLPNGDYQNQNSKNDITIYGLEYQGVLNLDQLGMAEGLKLKGGLTYTKAKEETENNGKQPYSDSDPLTGSIGLAYDDPDGIWGAEWTTYFARAKKAKDINPDDLNSPYNKLSPVPGYGHSNLTIYYKPIKGMHINAGIYNVFDKKYASWADSKDRDAYFNQVSYDQLTEPGRTFGANIRYDF